MSRAPSICSQPGCPEDATGSGRCAEHQRRAWANRSPSSIALNGAGRAAHRRARRAAARRAAGRCEECGEPSDDLQLHHHHPISQGGAIVQPNGRMLCTACHLVADRDTGARR
ncbi:hypothetical protein PAI11_37400 [Patulibacter medicamentivorans]|uniref:HNH nuclease domain-containing protein n=1 Tax=Patulibacter medicamentivorans TaxID=1097667 RepID=H0EA66_9ACTN|nr:HNH endonuclease [Patulibacter medicamentivorans]EHN09406.1 hypothetical protein PAI11_37400 [Patulibacter medicamentivorans]